MSKKQNGWLCTNIISLSKSLNAPGITVTVRAKVTFDNGGNNAANLRIYIGGANVFNADAPIFQLVKTFSNLP